MNLPIGENIRRMRRARNLTQEEAAAHLGISFQAISKWERGEGYPDVTLLPALAAYFGTTVDELLGMDRIAAQRKYDGFNRRWQENREAGRHRENAALMRESLKVFPNDALFMVQLSSSLERMEGGEEERAACLRESAAVQEQILRYTADSEVRSATMFNICFTYMKLGKRDQALEQARKLPNLYKARENALALLAEGEEKTEAARAAMEPLAWAVQMHADILANASGKPETADTGRRIAEMLRALANT